MLPATARLEELELDRLIEQQAYFVLHAPRQTGKTTAIQEWARQLTATGQYIGVWVSMEVGAAFPDDVGQAENALLDNWGGSLGFQLPRDLWPPKLNTRAPAGNRIYSFLTAWAAAAPRPLVLLLDEIDALQDRLLISVLRQLRSGYPQRSRGFPGSIGLVGLRDVRDYKVRADDSAYLHTSSPFNIAQESLTLRNFTVAEVQSLLGQHTAATGQPFVSSAQGVIFQLSQGQPWLVNALAQVCVQELVPERSQAIDMSHVHAAREMLVQRRQTHLDQLTDKLREVRIQRVMEPLLAGNTLEDIPPDDLEYAVDLGLVRHDPGGTVAVANPIYGEVIPRVLASNTQASLPGLSPDWLNADDSLNPDRLLEVFLVFWRQHGQPLLRSAPYHEIAPHLVLMAFLHRVTNAQGRVEREYAIGSRRIDLCLYYGDVRMAMELKVWREGERDPRDQGLLQLDAYLSGLGLDTGWLVIFDQRAGLPDISERTSTELTSTPGGRSVTLVRA